LLSFLFSFFRLCFLFGSFSSFSFAHPIFALHFLFYSFLFFCNKSPHFQHLFVRFVHFNQVIWRSLVLNLFSFELIQNAFCIILCHFISINLCLNLFLLFRNILWHLYVRSTMYTIIKCYFSLLELWALLQSWSFIVSQEISLPQQDQLFRFLQQLLFLKDLLLSEVLLEFLDHLVIVGEFYNYNKMKF